MSVVEDVDVAKVDDAVVVVVVVVEPNTEGVYEAHVLVEPRVKGGILGSFVRGCQFFVVTHL